MEVHLDRVLYLIADQATAVLEAERSSFFLYHPEEGELRSVVAQGAGALRLDANAGLAGYVLRSGRALRLADAYADPHFTPAIDGETGFRTHSVLSVPVWDRAGELVGVLQVLNKRNGGTLAL
jgi:adenylate cyclase